MTARSTSILCVLFFLGCGGKQTTQEKASPFDGRKVPTKVYSNHEAYCSETPRARTCKKPAEFEMPKEPNCVGREVALDSSPMRTGAGSCRVLIADCDGLAVIDTKLLCTVSSFDAAFPNWERASVRKVEDSNGTTELQLALRSQPLDEEGEKEILQARTVYCDTSNLVAQCRVSHVDLTVYGEDVEAFLGQLVKSVESHTWDSVLAMADPKHRGTQQRGGIKDLQYIAEALGLNYVGNSIRQGGELTRDSLNQITSFRVEDVARTRYGGYQVLATVSLGNGQVLWGFVSVVRRNGLLQLAGGYG